MKMKQIRVWSPAPMIKKFCMRNLPIIWKVSTGKNRKNEKKKKKFAKIFDCRFFLSFFLLSTSALRQIKEEELSLLQLHIAMRISSYYVVENRLESGTFISKVAQPIYHCTEQIYLFLEPKIFNILFQLPKKEKKSENISSSLKPARYL